MKGKEEFYRDLVTEIFLLLFTDLKHLLYFPFFLGSSVKY